MKNLVAAVIIILCLVIAYCISIKFLEQFHPDEKDCPEYLSNTDKENVRYNKEFSDKEYSEMKDLGKSFLTILVGVFVASITFSEKIIDFKISTRWSKFLLGCSWIFILGSIMLVGAGIAFYSGAFTEALHYPCTDIGRLWDYGSLAYAISGFAFGFAMVLMLSAGIISLIFQPESIN